MPFCLESRHCVCTGSIGSSGAAPTSWRRRSGTRVRQVLARQKQAYETTAQRVRISLRAVAIAWPAIGAGRTRADSKQWIHPKYAGAHIAIHTSDLPGKCPGVRCRWNRLCSLRGSACMFRHHDPGRVFRRI